MLGLAWIASCATVYAQNPPSYRGRSVQSVIDELRAAGLPLVYSTNLLTSDLLVDREPTASDPLAIVRELLSPHGLRLREANGAWLIVRGEAPPRAGPTGGVEATVAAATGEIVREALVQIDPPAGPSVAVVDGRASFAELSAGRHSLTVRANGYLPERQAFSVVGGAVMPLTITLAAAAPQLDQLTVTASRYDLSDASQPSSAYFSRDDIERFSEIGNDALRVVHRLPGIAASELSSRSHVRGGATDETTVILDGVKLIEAFHLRDYQSVFSAIDQRIVSGMQVYSGGFPAAYGDALSGLTVIDRVEPEQPLHHELGVSLLYTSALSSGTFSDGKGQWLASARLGNVDKLLNHEIGEPAYHDEFVHVGIALGPKHRLALNGFGFDDDITLTPENDPTHTESGSSFTDNNQMWLKLDSDWTDALSSQTIVHSTNFTSERTGVIDDADEMFGRAEDRRALSAVGLKQDWRWARSERQALTWGIDVEDLDGEYRYASASEYRGVFATLAPPPAPPRAYSLSPSGQDYSAYVADRLRITDRLIVDFGVRWDMQTYLPTNDDEQFSPRSSILYRLGAQTDLRFSFGRFFQSEDLLDLQVEDGVTEYAPAQNASHSITSIEHRFDNDLSLRAEVFRKWTHSARPRYENLYDPLAILPELQPGRVRVSPDRAETRGLEVVLDAEKPVNWWVAYSLSTAEDMIGAEEVPRSWDQRHAVTGGVAWDAGPWSLSAVATFHTGWPTTTLALGTVPGPDGGDQVIAVPGERNGERLPALRRIDFRASKVFDAAVGSLRFFAEVTNVTNRRNACCVRYDVVTLSDGSVQLDRLERPGLPFTPNVGVIWEF